VAALAGRRLTRSLLRRERDAGADRAEHTTLYARRGGCAPAGRASPPSRAPPPTSLMEERPQQPVEALLGFL
jgi:hypothetical protein